MFNIVITGFVSLYFTFVATGTVDKYGRKVLLLIGTLGLAVTFSMISLCYLLHLPGFLMLALVITVIIKYQPMSINIEKIRQNTDLNNPISACPFGEPIAECPFIL